MSDTRVIQRWWTQPCPCKHYICDYVIIEPNVCTGQGVLARPVGEHMVRIHNATLPDGCPPSPLSEDEHRMINDCLRGHSGLPEYLEDIAQLLPILHRFRGYAETFKGIPLHRT